MSRHRISQLHLHRRLLLISVIVLCITGLLTIFIYSLVESHEVNEFADRSALSFANNFSDSIESTSAPLEPELVTIFVPIISEEERPTPAPTVPWLDYINLFRSSVGLRLLDENSEWSNGTQLHSRYMVKNDYVGHYEDPSNPWYTPEGADAGGKSNVFVTTWLAASDEVAIDFWMTAPFHAVSIIDPQLKTSGYGSYREDDGGWRMGASLDVSRGIDTLPEDTSYPLLFPPANGQTWLLQYWGGEFPNPLSSCPGYSAPTGPPILVQLGPGDITPNVLGFSLESNGQLLDGCFYDETSYVNQYQGHENSGRIVLGNRDAVVLMPRQPLAEGIEYTATLTTSEGTIQWRFSTVSPPSLQRNAPAIEFEIR